MIGRGAERAETSFPAPRATLSSSIVTAAFECQMVAMTAGLLVPLVRVRPYRGHRLEAAIRRQHRFF